MRSDRLSLVLPTFNRSNQLNVFLKKHIPFLDKYNVDLLVFDNSSTDNTRHVVNDWMLTTSKLKYFCSNKNLDADKNFELAIKGSDSEYVWLVGDAYEIPEAGIEFIMDSGFSSDFLVFNFEKKIKISNKNYQECNEILRDLTGVMTCMSCLVYKKSIVSDFLFERYYDTNFLQTGVIFEYLAEVKGSSLFWCGDISVSAIIFEEKNKKINWSNTEKVWVIACDSWVNFIFSLPSKYRLENKLLALKSFGHVSGLFTWKGFLRLRRDKLFSFSILCKYYHLFYYLVKSRFFLFFIAFLPPSLISCFYKVFKRVK